MGHDIYARGGSIHSESPIYLRMAAWQPAKALYLALDAYECYGGVSGNGKEIVVDQDHLIHARKLYRDYCPGLFREWQATKEADESNNTDNIDEIKQYTFNNCMQFLEVCIGSAKAGDITIEFM